MVKATQALIEENHDHTNFPTNKHQLVIYLEHFVVLEIAVGADFNFTNYAVSRTTNLIYHQRRKTNGIARGD